LILFPSAASSLLLISSLRIQLAFKEDYEKELKGTLERRHAFHVQELDKMEEEKNMLERELDDANRRVDQAERETELAADDKSRVAKECENMIVHWRRKLTGEFWIFFFSLSFTSTCFNFLFWTKNFMALLFSLFFFFSLFFPFLLFSFCLLGFFFTHSLSIRVRESNE
jgi:hypothetical protein